MKSMKIADSLSVVSGRPATTSLEVAKFFGKRHDNVIRDIQEIITQLPENFLQLNFEDSAYEQETPMGIKQVRMFVLYRDGFMLLVMGYAGRKAMNTLEGIIDYGCHVCGHDRTALIHGICRVCNVPSLDDLPASGIRKALAAAWGIVNRGYTDVCL